MILKVFLFSKIYGAYQQYTADHYSATYLKQVFDNCSASDQIVIHRNGNLIYYAYAHKSSKSELCGICVVCGEICLNLQWLYEYFQSVLEASASKGVLFRYDEHGQIRRNVDKFSSEAAEVDNLFREIRENLNNRQSYWEDLPPEDFSIPLESKISFAFNEDSKDNITDAIRHYHNVVVTMDNTYPSSFASTVIRLNSENNQLQKDKDGLENKIRFLSKQKKQYRWVAILSIAVIASLVGLYFLNDNLSGIISNKDNVISKLESTVAYKKSQIELLHDTLSNKINEIKQKDAQIKNLNSNLDSVKDSLQKSESKLSELKGKFPINITDIEIGNTYSDGTIETDYGSSIYSSQSMYLKPKITYTGINPGRSIDLKIKWYMPDGSLSTGDSSPSGYSQQRSLYVNAGSNNIETLKGWGNSTKGNWEKGTYRIEIWYDNVCLKSQTFRIY